MTPRLAAIAGPLKGTAFTIAEEEISIGREPSNQLCVADRSLSRRHCLVKNESGQFKIADLNSLNGTFVNGVPVKERLLQHGDQIKLGDSQFLFLLDQGEPAPASSPVRLDESEIVSNITVQLRVDEAVYLQSEKVPRADRMARDLNVLLKISAEINSIRGLDALQRRLLELIFEATAAERGAVLLAGESLEEFASTFGWDKLEGVNRPVQVSRTVASKVLGEGVAVLGNDIPAGEAFVDAKSVMGSQASALLCVPMAVFGKVFGAIYIYTTDRAIHFDETDLQLVTAIAGIAAVALENARHFERLEQENRRLQEAVNIEHNMVGESPSMRRVYQLIAKAAPMNSTVLILGENGTGKELAARAIHQNSPRARGPFVAINCAALTETLLESELFGHERGAFTGAVAQKKGKLEVADGGTLFLDEVGEMAQQLQVKLLRVLQEREFERVGGTRLIRVDIRLIAATNKDLESAMHDGSFRQDLYYRLNVVRLVMPRLCERREDITLLASYFAAKYGEKCNRRVSGVSAEAQACLMAYDWPGNVRELENAIERAVVLGSTEMILPEDLPEVLLEVEPPADAPIARYHEAVNELKKQLIVKAVEQAGGNYTEAARLMGVHPNYLHRLIRNMNLKPALKK
jgi:transcriptional regulator with GAF, ATPase, and Fis domain